MTKLEKDMENKTKDMENNTEETARIKDKATNWKVDSYVIVK